MNKFIKHEFIASARLLLPLLVIFAASALVEGIVSRSVHVPVIIAAMVNMIYVVSFIAIFVVGLVIIISRFYKNTMTDSAYLTMTLPITEHEFIWGELITNIIWVVIIAAVLAVTSAFSVHISGFWNTFNSPYGYHSMTFEQIWQQMMRSGVSGFGMVSVGIQMLLGAIMLFIAFCMHFYCSMSVGQLFNKHRILMSVIAYIVIRMIIVYVSSVLVGTVWSGSFNYSFDTMSKTVDGINLFLGMANITLAADAAILYVPTFLLIGRKLNLQ